MSELKFRKVNALPGTLDPDTIYLVKSSDSSYAEIHISNSAGTSSKRVPTKQDIQSLIASEGGGGGGNDFDGLITEIITTTPFELVPGRLHILLNDEIDIELILPTSISLDSVFGIINASSNPGHWLNRNGHLVNKKAENIENFDLFNIPMTLKYLGVTYGVIPIQTLQGIVTGNTISGDGNAILNLNADNLATGTVPVARLGTNARTGTKFLRDDNTWQDISVNTLSATSSINASLSASVTSVNAGLFSGLPTIAFVNAAATADNRVLTARHNADGSFGLYLGNDALNTFSSFFQVTRSANVVTNLTIAATAITVDARVDFGKSYTEKDTTITATATTNIDCSQGNVFSIAMNASITSLTFSNIPASGRVYNATLFLAQDGTGGRSITWPAAVKWPGGTAPTLSAANKVDIVTLSTKNAGATWFASVAGQNY